MTLLSAEQEGDFGDVVSFDASVAGAELNVSVGLARLGQHPVYMTKVGTDPFGVRICRFAKRNGIDTSFIGIDKTRRTGSMLKSKVRNGDPSTFYFRKDSPASTIDSHDVEKLLGSGATVLHMTGIFPPLSNETRAASMRLMDEAHERGMFVSFDVNVRPALWNSHEQMVDTLALLSSKADLVLPGGGEGKELFGVEKIDEIGGAFIDNGAHYVVVKDGPRGAYATDGQNEIYVPGFVVDKVVDTVGAGDGFAAGVLSSLLEDDSMARALTRGCAVGAIQTQFVSDNEGLPTLAELEKFMETHKRAPRNY
ncbi:MAG: sugar kinase [Bifidobacteriaceae bacterium]|nr:sugar kinase [Bifidobacteriaceae bacterium]